MRSSNFAVAVVVALSALSARARPREALHVGIADGSSAPGLLDGTPCPPGRLPDGDACVHLPSDDEDDDASDAPISQNAHFERSGRYAIYDQIPRRPDRPAEYDAYRYPVPPGLAGGHFVLSGYDLDRPDRSQRRGWMLRAVGHGGVDLPDPKGTPVALVALEHQQGDADVIYAGPLFGTTVVTRQTVREAGQLRDYLVLFGHLDHIASGISRGSLVREGDVIGFVGDTGSPELVHLHLETRRVRDGVDITKKHPGELLQNATSVVCDPRNVLPLRDEKK